MPESGGYWTEGLATGAAAQDRVADEMTRVAAAFAAIAVDSGVFGDTAVASRFAAGATSAVEGCRGEADCEAESRRGIGAVTRASAGLSASLTESTTAMAATVGPIVTGMARG